MCGSGLAGLYLKSALAVRLFTVSRNWLSMGGAVPPGQQDPSCQSIRTQRGEGREAAHGPCRTLALRQACTGALCRLSPSSSREVTVRDEETGPGLCNNFPKVTELVKSDIWPDSKSSFSKSFPKKLQR